MLSFLHSKNFFYKNQFGFLKGHSTNQAILKIFNHIISVGDPHGSGSSTLHNINNGDYTQGLFLDIKKCFDCINHDILFTKLHRAGIKRASLKLTKKFFTK